MATRLLITPGRVLVSKQGFDVFTATHSQLQFDSDRAGAARFIKGSVAGHVGGGGSTDNRTVFFGQTFTVKPMVMITLLAGAGTTAPGERYPQKGLGDVSLVLSNFTFTWTRFEVRVLTDRVNFSFFAFGGSGYDYTVEYLVFNYRFGF